MDRKGEIRLHVLSLSTLKKPNYKPCCLTTVRCPLVLYLNMTALQTDSKTSRHEVALLTHAQMFTKPRVVRRNMYMAISTVSGIERTYIITKIRTFSKGPFSGAVCTFLSFIKKNLHGKTICCPKIRRIPATWVFVHIQRKSAILKKCFILRCFVNTDKVKKFRQQSSVNAYKMMSLVFVHVTTLVIHVLRKLSIGG